MKEDHKIGRISRALEDIRERVDYLEDLLTEDFTTFSLEAHTGFWRINGIRYKNSIYTIDLSTSLLPNKTQEEHAEHRKQVINNANEFYTPDYPLLHSTLATLGQNKDNSQHKDQIEQLRQFIKDWTSKYWFMTLTRIQYNSDNKRDKVIHNYKQPDQHEIELDSFIGPDGHILSKHTINIQEPLSALLDAKQTTQEINQIYKWLTGVDTYIWRIKSTPKKTTERVARFDASFNGAYLDCDWLPQDSIASFGVRAQKISTL